MTVSELMERLKTIPPEYEIHTAHRHDDGGCQVYAASGTRDERLLYDGDTEWRIVTERKYD